VANAVDGGVEGGWSTGRTTEVNGGDAGRLEGGIKADRGQVSTRVGLVGEMSPIIHDWGVATVHPRARVKFEGLVKWGGDIDRRGRLGELVRCLGEKSLLWVVVRGVQKLFVGLKGRKHGEIYKLWRRHRVHTHGSDKVEVVEIHVGERI
jgi:hypothetical protein